MLQGRQECRPSDGPATLLPPMVGMESCFFPSVPKLVLVGGLLGNWICGGEGFSADTARSVLNHGSAQFEEHDDSADEADRDDDPPHPDLADALREQ